MKKTESVTEAAARKDRQAEKRKARKNALFKECSEKIPGGYPSFESHFLTTQIECGKF